MSGGGRNNRLELEISQGGRGDLEQTMGGTYRDEGLSVGSDHMVIKLTSINRIICAKCLIYFKN